MISTSERNKLKESIDCREVADKLMGKPDQQGPRTGNWRCRFHDDRDPSLVVWSDGWHCFGCGASGDIYDLVMRVRNIQFAEAHAWLWHFANPGGSLSLTTVEMPRNTGKPAQRRKTWTDKQDEWRRLVDNACFRLDTADGEAGQTYLRGRGIESETSHVWSLGYVPNLQRRWKDETGKWQVEDLGPSISIPWTNGTTIKAIQYRLLKHRQRFHQESGGDRTLFGVQHVAGRPVLILVEGELNCVSIWQAAGDLVDVVSFGPEGNVERTGDLLRRVAGRYQQVLVWADKRNIARLAEKVAGASRAVASPIDRSDPDRTKKLDANELLQRGVLRSFVEELLTRLSRPLQSGNCQETIGRTHLDVGSSE